MNLEKIQQYIDMKRLIVKDNTPLTMRDLMESGLFNYSSVGDGIKLLAKVYFIILIIF